jgi:hypothetical protein
MVLLANTHKEILNATARKRDVFLIKSLSFISKVPHLPNTIVSIVQISVICSLS